MIEIKKVEGLDLSVEMNGYTMSYNDIGNGNVPILFIHGFPFNKSLWDRQLDYFSMTHRVISYDIRGFGNSTSGNQKFSIDIFAADLIEFLDKLEIPKAIVCGHSMGGYILLNAVEKFPDRFEKIILCNTQCIADSPAVKEKRMLSISQIIAGGLDAFSVELSGKMFGSDTINGDTELVRKIGQIIMDTDIATVTLTLSALMNRNESCSGLSGISTPALILCGDEDKIIPITQSEFLRENIPNSILTVVKGAGHITNFEQPLEFNRILKGYLT